MFFSAAEPTPFDLRFTLLGIPVRVHPFFWLFSAMMGWSEDPRITAVWVACVFVSILVHEFGHALVLRAQGMDPEVVLHAFGGYASHHDYRRTSTWQRLVMLFAGPGAGFLLYALVLLLLKIPGVNAWLHPRQFSTVGQAGLSLAAVFLLQINLWWGLINLLPVFPLDGGQMARELLRAWNPWRGVEVSLYISLGVGALVAAWFFTQSNKNLSYSGILFASMAFESFQALQSRRY
jgi:stage IV sporulation protein FB